jgi:hypothetical protein
MQLVEVTNSTVTFETDTASGTCEFVITDLHDEWDVKILKIQAIDDNTDLEYILTDEEETLLHNEIYDYVCDFLIDDLLDPDYYMDEDDWKYNDYR